MENSRDLGERGTPISNECSASSTQHIVRQLSAVVAILTTAGFGFWCLVDVLLLKLAPSMMHKFDWLLILSAVAVFCLVGFDLRRLEWPIAIFFAAMATILKCNWLFIVVVTLGVWFHGMIGGEL